MLLDQSSRERCVMAESMLESNLTDKTYTYIRRVSSYSFGFPRGGEGNAWQGALCNIPLSSLLMWNCCRA